jgi:hypothetical protein
MKLRIFFQVQFFKSIYFSFDFRTASKKKLILICFLIIETKINNIRTFQTNQPPNIGCNFNLSDINFRDGRQIILFEMKRN